MIQWVMAAILTLCGTSVFTACTVANDDNPAQPDPNVAKYIIGQWMDTEINGNTILTNQKFVFNFLSLNQASVSISNKSIPVYSPLWFANTKFDISIVGNVISFTIPKDEHTTMLQEITISSISANKMECAINQTVYSDISGKETLPVVLCTFQKVSRDYSAEVIGTWAGVSTSETSLYGDIEKQRWQYNPDGTYVFYMKNDKGEWVATENVYSDYFVAGNLLCTRFKNVGDDQQDHSAWWEIQSIEDGVMKCTAQRKNDDGTTYTATFETKKVE